MYKRIAAFIFFVISISCISGYWVSKINWVGQLGIFMFYRNYSFLKIWWQPSLLIFIIYLLLTAILTLSKAFTNKNVALTTNIILILLGLSALYYSYFNFRNNLSYRLLGERFHLGIYVFWLGFIAINLFFLFYKMKEVKPIDPTI